LKYKGIEMTQFKAHLRNGFIQSYNSARGIGTIFSDKDRFWFHRDRIIRGDRDPAINSLVLFEISSKPILPGRLRVAINIIIEDVPAGADAPDVTTAQTSLATPLAGLAGQNSDKAAI
jgi:hypothetical protein